MDEVDGILIYTLNHIGCDVGSDISCLSPSKLIDSVTRCLQISRPDLQLDQFEENSSMNVKYKAASHLAQLLTDLGYKEEIGCQSFLYPSVQETRKILIFLVEKLPRDGLVGDQIDTLLSKIAKTEADEDTSSSMGFANGVEVDGIRLPAAVNVDSLPKETLKFYASHLADISFAKQREKYRNKPEVPSGDTLKSSSEQDDDDFGDPDIPEEKPVVIEKPAIPVKPKGLEKNTAAPDNNQEALKKAEAEEELTKRIKELQQCAKVKVKTIKEKERIIKENREKAELLDVELQQLNSKLLEKEKILDRLRKTDQLLSGDQDALEKVKSAVSTQVEKLMNLSRQWETHRKPLVDEIREKQFASELSETGQIREEVRSLKSVLKEMVTEAKNKEGIYNQLLKEYEKLPKDLSRSSYTRRIAEIIGNIKKQKREIAKVLADTKEIQKDINTLSGRLDRTFTVADELIFKLADKDKNVALSYKLLVTIHSDFSRIIKVLEEIGTLKRQQRDLEDKLELEKSKSVEDKLNRLKADMTQMQHENKILEAKLRDPALQHRS